MLPHQPAALALSLAVAAASAAPTTFKLHPSPTPAAPTIVRVTAPNGGFDWRDAGIGAAGGFALSMIGLGAALAASSRRPRHLGQQERRASAPQPSTSQSRRQP